MDIIKLWKYRPFLGFYDVIIRTKDNAPLCHFWTDFDNCDPKFVETMSNLPHVPNYSSFTQGNSTKLSFVANEVTKDWNFENTSLWRHNYPEIEIWYHIWNQDLKFSLYTNFQTLNLFNLLITAYFHKRINRVSKVPLNKRVAMVTYQHILKYFFHQNMPKG